MKHADLHDTPADLAALYVAGALPEGQRTEFEAHLVTCELCRSEVGELASVAAALAADVPPVTPSAELRAKILNTLPSSSTVAAARAESDSAGGASQPWKLWKPRPGAEDVGLHILRRDDGVWEDTASPGVRVRRLFVDAERNQFTALIRMTPGSSYPRHVHNGAEECLVLEGELHVGDTVLRAGDYQRAPAGSQHGVQSTETGCLLLIVSSLTDELY